MHGVRAIVSAGVTARLGLAVVATAMVLAAQNADAGGYCEFSRELGAQMDLNGITSVEVLAVSGDLMIRGDANIRDVSAEGTACVEKRYRDRLDEFRIVEERDGSKLRIIAYVPYRNDDEDWRVGGLDLTIVLPDSLPLDVADSSGDIRIEAVHSLVLNDSSGDIILDSIQGDILIERDSSGDIDIRRASNVHIKVDSSGDIDVRDAMTVHVGKDSSGSIHARDITGDVMVGADSSGEIVVTNVGGNFTVEHDGSGAIRHRQVAGTVRIPRDY
ncbi:MAG: hypothetical protein AAFN78_02910 [Pseudomonadota bacterium]